jgi:hypothetical protein
MMKQLGYGSSEYGAALLLLLGSRLVDRGLDLHGGWRSGLVIDGLDRGGMRLGFFLLVVEGVGRGRGSGGHAGLLLAGLGLGLDGLGAVDFENDLVKTARFAWRNMLASSQ